MKDNVIMIAIILVIFACAWTTFYAMEDRIVVEIVRIVSNTIVKSAIPVKLNTQGTNPATMTFTKSGRVEDVDLPELWVSEERHRVGLRGHPCAPRA